MKGDSFQIAMLIKEIYASTIEIASGCFKDSNLTHQQITVIKLIGHNEKVTVSELCEEMALTKGTVSGIVSRLESAGYIKKVKDEKDKRTIYIKFSEKGLEFANSYRCHINEGFDKIFENFTDDEIVEVKNNLLKIRDKLKK